MVNIFHPEQRLIIGGLELVKKEGNYWLFNQANTERAFETKYLHLGQNYTLECDRTGGLLYKVRLLGWETALPAIALKLAVLEENNGPNT